MKRKVTYIPTLQEYVRKRKKENAEFPELENCKDCNYFRSNNQVCLWGDSVKSIKSLKNCPINQREL